MIGKLSLLVRTFSLAAVAAVLAACSSALPLEVAVSSHEDGEVVTGSRSITVSGTIEGGGTRESASATLNGSPISTVDFDQDSFDAEVELEDDENVIEIVVTDADGETESVSLTITYPFLSLGDFQEASVVVGQDSFTENATGLDAESFSYLYGNPAYVQGNLYLPDYGNDRVLIFDGVPATNGAAASQVLGQTDFVSNVQGVGADAMDAPQTVATDGTHLFVADYGNERVLIWNDIPEENGEPADSVLGQVDLDSAAAECTRSGLDSPESIFVVDGKIIVADSTNNRVLVWDEVPSENGVEADLVLGQADFESCEANRGGAITAGSMSYPSDAWSDGERLVVLDSVNRRLLFWNEMPTENGAEADLVLGQADMTSAVEDVAADRFGYPYFMASNGNQLFVADNNNNRVLVWDEFPSDNGGPADHVLGQGDFDGSAPNDDDGDGAEDVSPSSRTLNQPTGVAVVEGKLVVADRDNYRYLIFEPSAD